MRVSDVMCRPVVSCTPETSLSSAARMMGENDCGALPVLRGKTVVGMVTDRDICVAIGKRKKAASETTVREIFSPGVVTCSTSDDVRSALATMASRHVRRLPVLDADGALQGIVSLDDLMLRAEEPRPTGAPPDLSHGDVVTAFRSICGKRPLRKPA